MGLLCSNPLVNSNVGEVQLVALSVIKSTMMQWEDDESRGPGSWLLVPLSLTGSVTLDESLFINGFHFSHLSNYVSFAAPSSFERCGAP